MINTKSIFYFKSKDGNVEWRVEYFKTKSNGKITINKRDISDYFTNDTCIIYFNSELYWDFDGNIPYTDVKNPTKTQANQLITIAKRLYKEKFKVRDSRNKMLNKLLN